MPPCGNVSAATVASHVDSLLHTLMYSWEDMVAMVMLTSLLSVCRSEGKTCGVCMEQVMAKLMRSERRFGIMCKRIRTVFLISMHGCHATSKNIVLFSTLPACGEKMVWYTE